MAVAIDDHIVRSPDPHIRAVLAFSAPEASGNHSAWATDICCIPMARGFACLVAVVDWFSRRVLSHRVSITREADFCVEALGGSCEP